MASTTSERGKACDYTVGMLAAQGSCRAHASPMIRVRECRGTNTGCYMHGSGVGLERFTVAATVHSGTAIAGAPIVR
jgi:hypothetical protein